MSDHKSVPYNPDIANTFYRAGYIEAWGRGIQKICDACKNLGAEVPEYIVHGRDVMVRFKALESAIVSDSKVPKVQNEPLQEPLDEPLEIKVLNEIKQNVYVTYAKLEQSLHVSRSTVKRTIKILVEKKILERKGGKRYGYWEVREK